MPRYVYECPDCSKTFEVEKRIADSSRAESCPVCKTEARRIFTAPAITGSSMSSGNDSGGSCPSGGCCPGGTCRL